MCTLTWCTLNMVHGLAWWWLYESKHVATFIIDNKLVVFWLLYILSNLVKHIGMAPIKKKKGLLRCAISLRLQFKSYIELKKYLELKFWKVCSVAKGFGLFYPFQVKKYIINYIPDWPEFGTKLQKAAWPLDHLFFQSFLTSLLLFCKTNIFPRTSPLKLSFFL
jgi:hypothetical protein